MPAVANHEELRAQYLEARRQYDADLPQMDQQEWENRTREMDRLRDIAVKAQAIASERWRRRVRPTIEERHSDILDAVRQATAAIKQAQQDQTDTMRRAAEMGCSYETIARAASVGRAAVVHRIGRRSVISKARSKPPVSTMAQDEQATNHYEIRFEVESPLPMDEMLAAFYKVVAGIRVENMVATKS